MDDFAEMYAMPSWPDVNAMTKFPWDQHSGLAVNALGHSHFQPPDKSIPETLSSHQQTLLGILANSTHSSAMSSLSEIESRSLVSRHIHEAAAFAALRRMQEGCSQTSSSERIASSSSEIASSVINQMHAASPTWPQTYVEGMPFQHTPGGSKVQSFMQQEATQTASYLCGRRQMDNALAGQNEGAIAPIYGHQAQQIRTTRQQVSHGISAAPYNPSNTGLVQQQQGAAAAVVAGTTRPRVRARRGQATDPHSIAERLRRERIADRMKALQELVPNVNKTDKALMLDEIIEYVRFLQLQVKILNMSRLSGTGAIVPIMAELPSESLVDIASNALLKEGNVTCSSEDNLITIEGQVAKLMEESMGSALQFLQSKGLCLMPITLATAMSSSNTRQLTGSLQGKSNAASSPFRNSQNVVIPMTSVHPIGDMFSSELCAAIRNSRESLSQPIAAASFPGALHMHN